MNAPNQPDIEIYVKGATVEELRSWLAQRFGALENEASRGAMQHFRAERDGSVIPVRVMPGAVGKQWTSVWLDSPDTPWANDLACARDCFSFVGKEVRCATGSWQEDDDADPDAFLRVNADGETEISWKTE
jgi:hypothetical protein